MYCKNVNSTGAILKGTLYIDSLRNARGSYHIFVVGGRALTFCPCHQVILKVKSDGYKMWSLSHGERERERPAVHLRASGSKLFTEVRLCA